MIKKGMTEGLIRRPFILFVVMASIMAASWVAASDFDPNVPVAFRDRLYDVQFISDTDALLVGYPGKVFKTTDAGTTWKIVDIGETEPLFAVDFVNDKKGWIVGRKGLVFTTNDGGDTWTKQDSGVEDHLFAVHFVSEKAGIAVGNFGVVINTSDGGKTWSSQILEEMSSATIYAVSMTDEKTAFLAGEYPTWEAQLEVDVEASTLSSVFKTVDGGLTWQRVAVPAESHLFDLKFKTATEGYAVGTKGMILKTVDGGETWEIFTAPTAFHLLSFDFAGGGLVAAGNAGTVVTMQGGDMNTPSTGAYSWLRSVSFNQQGKGILVGDHGVIMLSDDKGRTWNCASPTCKSFDQQKTK